MEKTKNFALGELLRDQKYEVITENYPQVAEKDLKEYTNLSKLLDQKENTLFSILDNFANEDFKLYLFEEDFPAFVPSHPIEKLAFGRNGHVKNTQIESNTIGLIIPYENQMFYFLNPIKKVEEKDLMGGRFLNLQHLIRSPKNKSTNMTIDETSVFHPELTIFQY